MKRNLRLALGAALLLTAGCGHVTGDPTPRRSTGGARSELQVPHREASWMIADRSSRLAPDFNAADYSWRCLDGAMAA